jgi:16S rRNA (cytidine1402-2'-O)-methyltransferase
MEPGTLFLVATPIGNLADITLRALETLRSVHWIAAEDTRHTRKLLSHYQIHKPLLSYHSHNARQRAPELLAKLHAGESVALVTDAGTPGISDPGTLLVGQALAEDLPVTVLPGAAALLVGLVASGLPTHPFVFLGFPPPRTAGRKRFFSEFGTLTMTLVLYESPQRLLKTLNEMLLHWGDRKIAVARELTKFYEEVFRGTISEALEHFHDGVRGEVTLIVAGAVEPPSGLSSMTARDWRQELQDLMQHPEQTVKTAADQISSSHRLPRRLVYQEALRIKATVNLFSFYHG